MPSDPHPWGGTLTSPNVSSPEPIPRSIIANRTEGNVYQD